jgi:aminoglycoside phosphotransferase (APT) family kinase protein
MTTQAEAPTTEQVQIPTKLQLRDLDAVRPAIERWLRSHVRGGSDLEVTEVRLPGGAGVANETLLVRARHTARGGRADAGYVVRVGATEHLFMGMDVHTHYRIYERLSHEPHIPSPPIVGFEPDTGLFGQPFFVMERIEGLVPPDDPHFYRAGWLVEMSPADQHEVWRGFVEVMAKLHRVDLAKFSFLDRPHLGRTGIEQELNHWLAYAKWCGADQVPVVRKAANWLIQNLPRDAPPGFSWGDSRPPNIIYQGTRLAAVLDWDMVSLAGAECDLAWWAYMDHAYTVGRDQTRPPGFGSRRDALMLWQELVGRPAENIDWHLALNALRIKLVMVRLPAMLLSTGQLTPEQAAQLSGHDNMEWLGGLLDAPATGPLGSRWPGWDD